MVSFGCDAPDEENLRRGTTTETADVVVNTETLSEPGEYITDETSTEEPIDIVVDRPVEIIENVVIEEIEEISYEYSVPERTGDEDVEQQTSDSPTMMLSARQLRNSIGTCIAPDMTAIQAASVISIDADRSEDAFLLPLLYADGDDIIDRNRESLDGPASNLATSTRDNRLSVTYLTALRAIANVVAHNCELLGTSNGNCSCDSEESAADMLNRCLPQYHIDQETTGELIEEFRTSCELDQRGAIAALLSSIGFAVTP